MAFFKFRKGSDDPAAPAKAPESVEAMRKRAKHRLIGAAVLVLAGVIGFPLLFDNQPRPIAVDIPIEIPDKAKAKPLIIAPQVAPVASPTVASGSVGSTAAAPTSSSAGVVEKPPVVKPVAPASAAVARVAGGSVTGGPAAAPAPTATPSKPAAGVNKPVPANAEAAKALALLEGKEVLVESKPAVRGAAAASAAPATGRFIVQVGAYADVVKAREVRQKLEQAGLKTYTQVISGTDGKRIRVRIGPYESKAEADKAAEKVRKLDLPAGILEL